MELRDLGESWFVILVQETVKRERERVIERVREISVLLLNI